jgi:hypothetical protein
LKEDYIKGVSFTMGGKRVVMERVVAPPKELPPDEDRKSPKQTKKKPAPERETAKVISLFERK